MELKLENGDYVPDGIGGLRRVQGREELLQRILFKLTARRGMFPFREELGSRLWQLGRLSTGQRQSAAAQYVAEALQEERDVSVETVELSAPENGVARLQVALTYEGEPLAVNLDVRV